MDCLVRRARWRTGTEAKKKKKPEWLRKMFADEERDDVQAAQERQEEEGALLADAPGMSTAIRRQKVESRTERFPPARPQQLR